MDKFSRTYLNFMSGTEVINNTDQNQTEKNLTENYENIADAMQYNNSVQNVENPLKNEVDILQYARLLQKENENSSNPSTFDPVDEAEKITSGYYIDINESLNIFKQYYNTDPNPFLYQHEQAMEYLKFAQKQYSSPGNMNPTFPSEDLNFESINSEIETASVKSCFFISDTGICDNYSDTDDNIRKVNEEIEYLKAIASKNSIVDTSVAVTLTENKHDDVKASDEKTKRQRRKKSNEKKGTRKLESEKKPKKTPTEKSINNERKMSLRKYKNNINESSTNLDIDLQKLPLISPMNNYSPCCTLDELAAAKALCCLNKE